MTTPVHSENQLHLPIQLAGEEPWINCRGIFSLAYLRQHLAKSENMPPTEECRVAYDRLKSLWTNNYAGLRQRSEAYTRTQFLDPVLESMSWVFIPEQDLPAQRSTHKRPDYCLFGETSTQQRAASQSHTDDVFRESATVLEAKKAGHHLDKVSDKETPGWFPSQQIQDYLRHAKDSTGERYFNWAILTNGNQWRLYCEQAPVDAFFAFHLAHEEEFCPFEDFRFFYALFRPAAFERSEGRCLLDQLRESSLTLQAELETNLRKRIFDVLEDLANAFRDNPANQITEAEFKELYNNSLIYLYRLLFVLYAESRDLLPAKPSGLGSNKRYREQFSLARMVAKLRDRNSFSSDAFDDVYKDLLRLFHLINGDRPQQNKECNVTRYNGGLFNPKEYPLIEKWWIGDKLLANILRQLIFAQPPARSSARQQQISTEEAIDYSTLEVRQLGDIYEGLLGGILQLENGRLQLKDENGQNHRHGIFYTPDWVVEYLVRETLQPLIDEIEKSDDVAEAKKARSEEKRRDNSFALAILRLNIVDPAMGSGHFLVRATEWLAEQILYHPTTRLMTEQIGGQGERRRSREDIVKAGRIPVPTGVSQEQAEIAYWRRRVVEACIYGVDINPLAVELAKLALWLTCIAVDEPLNFLDHHLRCGNSLLAVRPDELKRAPYSAASEEQKTTFDVGESLVTALRDVIAQNVDIEITASTEMEIVKAKEERWKTVRQKIAPFLSVGNLWLAALDGLPINDVDYRLVALLQIAPDQLSKEEKTRSRKLLDSLEADLGKKSATLTPFHWQLEFPDVYFEPDGQPRPESLRGFDAVLGNPPYISTHTSSAEGWRNALQCRTGWLEDLYVHFANLGFEILREGGGFGFIVSDTFFTLASKLRMRELLQRHRLTHLGQCDPFDATVDAAIFVVRKASVESPDAKLLFIQARPRKDENGRTTKPERALPALPNADRISWKSTTELSSFHVDHAVHGCLRVHRAPLALYRNAHKRVFFEPRPATLRLYEKFNEPVNRLVEEWWDQIETSQKFSDHLDELRAYHATLKPGDITLVGLIAEGGQGMRTANNARFLGYLEGTPQAREIEARRQAWTQRWLGSDKIQPIFLELVKTHGGDLQKPTTDGAAWEATIEPLKTKFSLTELGFTKSDLYRIVPKSLVATDEDFQFAWQKRKPELLKHWREEGRLKSFWEGELQFGKESFDPRPFKGIKKLSDADFCVLCQHLQKWFARENAVRREFKKPLIPKEALALRSSESYSDPTDAPRIAAIYNGLSGRGFFVPFRKGDPVGNRWVDNEPLYIDWSQDAARWLSESPEARWQGHRFFLTEGVTWSLHANHVATKARLQQPCVFDASGSRLTPSHETLSAAAFLGFLNSDVFSFFLKKFVKHNQDVEINDLRMMPLVIPTKPQEKKLRQLAEWAIEAKRLTFSNTAQSQELVVAVRRLSEELLSKAPKYLHPPAQLRLLTTAEDALSVIELAVNWEAEKLYGVEGLGPFDEF